MTTTDLLPTQTGEVQAPAADPIARQRELLRQLVTQDAGFGQFAAREAGALRKAQTKLEQAKQLAEQKHQDETGPVGQQLRTAEKCYSGLLTLGRDLIGEAYPVEASPVPAWPGEPPLVVLQEQCGVLTECRDTMQQELAQYEQALAAEKHRRQQEEAAALQRARWNRRAAMYAGGAFAGLLLIFGAYRMLAKREPVEPVSGAAASAPSGSTTLATGFDCATARSITQVTICRDPGLAAAALRMNSLNDAWNQAGEPQRGQNRERHRIWFTAYTRECQSASVLNADPTVLPACIHRHLAKRIGELESAGSPASGPRASASSDCAKATTPSELTVCGDARLAQLDVDVAAAHLASLVAYVPREVANQERIAQANWRHAYAAKCDVSSAVASCVESELTARLAAVEQNPWRARASSALVEQGFHHGPAAAFDEDPATAWVEGASGPGVGEWVEAHFPARRVSSVMITPGLAANRQLFFANHRPQQVSVVVAGVTPMVVTFADDMSKGLAVFAGGAMTDSVRITVLSVFAGSKYDDTPIAEISWQ